MLLELILYVNNSHNIETNSGRGGVVKFAKVAEEYKKKLEGGPSEAGKGLDNGWKSVEVERWKVDKNSCSFYFRETGRGNYKRSSLVSDALLHYSWDLEKGPYPDVRGPKRGYLISILELFKRYKGECRAGICVRFFSAFEREPARKELKVEELEESQEGFVVTAFSHRVFFEKVDEIVYYDKDEDGTADVVVVKGIERMLGWKGEEGAIYKVSVLTKERMENIYPQERVDVRIEENGEKVRVVAEGEYYREIVNIGR